MKCQWCGKEFPHKKGRFCGSCQKPKTKDIFNMKPSQLISRADIDAAYDKLHEENTIQRAALNEGEPILIQAADRIVTLEDQVIQLQTENEKLKENQSCGECEDDEQNRWCERLEWLHTEYGADSSVWTAWKWK